VTVLAPGKAHHALLPVQVFQAQAGDLAGAYPQTSGEQHDGEVAFSVRSLTIDARQNPQHLGGRQSPRRVSEAVVRRREEGGRPVAVDVSQTEQITQQAAQDFMNAVNAADVVGGLLAGEAVEVLDLKLTPIADLIPMEEAIEAAIQSGRKNFRSGPCVL
jgi:hypothetical protein